MELKVVLLFTYKMLRIRFYIVTLFPKNSSSKIKDSGERYKILKISFGNKTIVYLEGISDRNIVEELIPFIIKVNRSSFPEIGDKEYYISDLIGVDLFCPITDRKLGIIKSSYDNGAQVVFEVELLDGKIVDIPFIEQFFKSVDLEKRVAKVVLPRVVE
jgi:16S rRNA processing protein RimM